MGDIAMRHVVAAIGEEAAQALEEQLGGKRIVIPKTIGANHPIGAAIGIELAAKLSEELAGAVLDVPIAAAKKARVKDALRKGKSVNTIVAELHVSVRYVWYVKAELAAEAEPKQLGLF